MPRVKDTVTHRPRMLASDVDDIRWSRSALWRDASRLPESAEGEPAEATSTIGLVNP
jgi:hypothetical protein